MGKPESFNELLNLLKYGKSSAVNIKDLAAEFEPSDWVGLKNKIQALAHEARSNGHWVIVDNDCYYLAVDRSEWNAYKKQRLMAINNELKAIASCDNISFADLIKEAYAVSPADKNYELF
jgi:hypothetical protein